MALSDKMTNNPEKSELEVFRYLTAKLLAIQKQLYSK